MLRLDIYKLGIFGVLGASLPEFFMEPTNLFHCCFIHPKICRASIIHVDNNLGLSQPLLSGAIGWWKTYLVNSAPVIGLASLQNWMLRLLHLRVAAEVY
jgi:hypothetical protein